MEWSPPVDADISSINVYQNGISIVSFVPSDFTGGLFNYTTPALAPGVYAFNVGVSDGATEVLSNAVNITVEVPNPAPVKPSIQNAVVLNFNTVKLSWTQDAGDTDITSIGIIQNGVEIATFGPNDHPNNEFTTGALADGVHSLRVRLGDGVNTVLSDPVVIVVDDRPSFTAFAGRVPDPTPAATTLVLDNVTHTGILPDKVILNWATTAGSSPVAEYIIYKNNVEYSRVAGTATGYVSGILPLGTHTLAVEAKDATGKVSDRQVFSATIDYLRPVINLSATYNATTGAVDLDWHYQVVDSTEFEIQKALSSIPNDPTAFTGTKYTTTSSRISITLPHEDRDKVVYFDVRVKKGNQYSVIQKQVSLRVNHSANSFWDNLVRVDAANQIPLAVWQPDVIPAANIMGNSIESLTIHIPGASRNNINSISINSLATGGGYSHTLRSPFSNDIVFDSSTDLVTIPKSALQTPAGALPRINDSFDIGVNLGTLQSIHRTVSLLHSSDQNTIDASVVNGSYRNILNINPAWNPLETPTTMTFQNGSVTIQVLSGLTLTGTATFTSRYQGYLTLSNSSGSVNSIVPFSVFYHRVSGTMGINIQVLGSKYPPSGRLDQFDFIKQ